MKSRLSRAILVLHRYLGVLVGVLMTVWCLSGFVMMYQDYPAVTQEERLAGLQPLDLTGPLALDSLPFADGEDVAGFRVEMLGGRPVLRMGGRGGGAYDLRTGEEVAELSVPQVAEVARRHAIGNGIAVAGVIEPRLMVEMDQWTISPFRTAQPLYHVTLGDRAGSEIYVSAASGTVVQDTNRKERVLNWLGAIPHWLYPTMLRQNGPLWTEVVIWTSVIGTFLTVTGLYVGIGRMRRPRQGRGGGQHDLAGPGRAGRVRAKQQRSGRSAVSPYRGLWYWHHMTGLFFGLLTLTWVFSGLMTMGPWGVFQGPPNTLRQDISGHATWAETRTMLERVSDAGLPQGTVELRPAPLGGQLHVLTRAAGADPLRLDRAGQSAPLTEGDVRGALAGLPVASFDRLTGDDAYHYGFKGREAPPAYRAILDDEQRTRVYVDAATGEVARIVDGAARQSRWLRNGLHSLDFIRGRPLWDALTLLLMAGVTAVCATGAWMSFRRVSRDVRMMRRRLRNAGARSARGRRGTIAPGERAAAARADGSPDRAGARQEIRMD